MYLLEHVKDAFSIYEKNNLLENYYTKIKNELNEKYKTNISRHSVSKWINNKKNIENRTLRDLLKNKNLSLNLIFKDKNTKIKRINYNILKKYIKKFPFSTVHDIQNFIKINFNFSVSTKTITKIFKILKLTRKKVKYHIVKDQKFLDQLEINRNLFIEKIKTEIFNKIIFIDESGFNLSENDKGLSIKGEKINLPKKNLKTNNISLLMAITKDEILNYNIYKSSVNKVTFFEFIKNIIKNLKEDNYLFVFDNASIHKDEDMLNFIKNSNNNYLFTPPYSPNLNPIENTFGIIKNIYREQLKNYHYEDKNLIFLIENSLIIFNALYKSQLESICKRSFKYSYIDIEKRIKR